ncbi:DUF6176 family protein [Sporolactobacillus nakayamae]|uniref:NIPSNAP protein n=1 Tax=Sporolactobacillus nakayamae TaxID=269670 RepID=A0A1I2V2V1_9BACL|nr:DUF6176 family protein [Sporolactobacillus nakayamae]SFG83658.1 hypothetical protein SAMN02982927_02933 [Sporolactobacillus nakayamae]
MQIELSKFRVKKGKTKQVDQWMNMLNEHMPEVLLTLENEKMYIETIFREKNQDEEYLYWYSVQGDNGAQVEESSMEIDKKHLAYWRECIDESYHAPSITTEVHMIPDQLGTLINKMENNH